MQLLILCLLFLSLTTRISGGGFLDKFADGVGEEVTGLFGQQEQESAQPDSGLEPEVAAGAEELPQQWIPDASSQPSSSDYESPPVQEAAASDQYANLAEQPAESARSWESGADEAAQPSELAAYEAIATQAAPGTEQGYESAAPVYQSDQSAQYGQSVSDNTTYEPVPANTEQETDGTGGVSEVPVESEQHADSVAAESPAPEQEQNESAPTLTGELVAPDGQAVSNEVADEVSSTNDGLAEYLNRDAYNPAAQSEGAVLSVAEENQSTSSSDSGQTWPPEESSGSSGDDSAQNTGPGIDSYAEQSDQSALNGGSNDGTSGLAPANYDSSVDYGTTGEAEQGQGTDSKEASGSMNQPASDRQESVAEDGAVESAAGNEVSPVLQPEVQTAESSEETSSSTTPEAPAENAASAVKTPDQEPSESHPDGKYHSCCARADAPLPHGPYYVISGLTPVSQFIKCTVD